MLHPPVPFTLPVLAPGPAAVQVAQAAPVLPPQPAQVPLPAVAAPLPPVVPAVPPPPVQGTLGGVAKDVVGWLGGLLTKIADSEVVSGVGDAFTRLKARARGMPS